MTLGAEIALFSSADYMFLVLENILVFFTSPFNLKNVRLFRDYRFHHGDTSISMACSASAGCVRCSEKLFGCIQMKYSFQEFAFTMNAILDTSLSSTFTWNMYLMQVLTTSEFIGLHLECGWHSLRLSLRIDCQLEIGRGVCDLAKCWIPLSSLRSDFTTTWLLC